VYIESTHH